MPRRVREPQFIGDGPNDSFVTTIHPTGIYGVRITEGETQYMVEFLASNPPRGIDKVVHYYYVGKDKAAPAQMPELEKARLL